MRSTICLVVLLAIFSLSHAQFKIPCGFAYANGTYVSLQNLTGNYYFTNPPVTGNTNGYPQPAGNITVEVAICQAVTTQNPTLCTNSNSAVNVIYNETVCVSAGDVSVAGWDSNPSTEGGSLIYYHGTATSHVNELSTRIYFECGTQNNLTYEFYSANYTQFHLIITTPDVCASNSVTPPAPTPVSITCTAPFLNQTVDLSPLTASNGSYIFYNINNMTGINFEVQICDNVKSNYTYCTIPSPANLVDTNTKTCTPVADKSAYAWALNPDSGDGVNLILYHGAPLGPVGTLQTRIYFECSAIYNPPPEFAVPPETLIWEHFSPPSGNGGSYHLTITTKYACPANLPTTTGTTNAGTTNAGTTGTGTTNTGTTNTGTSSAPTSTTSSPASFLTPCFAAVATALAFFFL